MSDQPTYAKGLAGVIVAESKICKIDGLKGMLSYRGYRIEDLAANYDFEQVTYLLLEGELPTGAHEERGRTFCRMLRDNRAISERVVAFLKSFPKHTHVMDMLQAVVPLLGAERNPDGESIKSNCVGSEHLIAQFATVVAAIYRIRKGMDVIAPRNDLNHGANFLYMLHGTEPSKNAAAVMDTCLTLHAEHSFNASTFTARVISSTLAHCCRSISGAIGSLSGPLHGGANEQVLRMVDEIGSADNTTAWIDNALANKQKIMGMGHRVYKAKDPRAFVIEKLLAKLNEELPHNNDYDILKKIEAQVGEYMHKKGKPVYPNVDFFSGAAYRMLEIPTNLFTAIFAVARVSGWMAHIREQAVDNRIYRPKALYTGPDIRKL